MSSVARRARESEIVEASVRKTRSRRNRPRKAVRQARQACEGRAERSERAWGAASRGAAKPMGLTRAWRACAGRRGRSDRVWGATLRGASEDAAVSRGLRAFLPALLLAGGRGVGGRCAYAARRRLGGTRLSHGGMLAPLGHAPLTRRTLRRATSLLGGIARIGRRCGRPRARFGSRLGEAPCAPPRRDAAEPAPSACSRAARDLALGHPTRRLSRRRRARNAGSLLGSVGARGDRGTLAAGARASVRRTALPWRGRPVGTHRNARRLA